VHKSNIYICNNGCPYAGNIFTVKTVLLYIVQEYFFTLKKISVAAFLVFTFHFSLTLVLKFHSFIIFKTKSPSEISLFFRCCGLCSKLSPAAPAAALAASERPSLAMLII
jgi:hypothetical protein